MPKHREMKADKKRAFRSQDGSAPQARQSAKRRRVESGQSPEIRANLNYGPANDKPKGNRRIMLWTVGHSTHPLGDFIALLQAHGIRQLVDVRTIPRSRHNPQFNQDQLPAPLKETGIRYIHMTGLGGLRRAHRDSLNTAWRNASFRGFADYMQTAEFDVALKELIRLARSRPTAIMCAEAVPWRCHRSLIADALLVRGLQVEEITGKNSVRMHTLTPWARVVGDRITYPIAAALQQDATRQSANVHPHALQQKR